MRLFIALLPLIATPVFADNNPGPPLRDKCYAGVIATAFDDLRKSLETVLASRCGDLRRPPRDQVSDADADSFSQFRRDINMAITLSAIAQIAYETEALWERD